MKTNASRKLADVSPTNRSERIEIKALRLDALRRKIAELEAEKTELAAQLLKLVKLEGEADDEGKIRYQSTEHNFLVVGGKSVKLDPKRLMKFGVSASIIKKSTVETPYEYVRVDVRKDEEGD